MTATSLAAAAGVSKSFISQLESGRSSASLATLGRIATALDVPTGLLLSAASPQPNSSANVEQANLLHSRDQLPGGPASRLLADLKVAAHALVTLPPGRRAEGNAEAGGGLLLTVLRGGVTVHTRLATLGIAAGDVATLEPAGEYELLSEGPGPAQVLVSGQSPAELPRIVNAGPGATAHEPAYDTTGPLRLVSMRARRAAGKAR
jgi:transcriptional regulator with XRE-family HTH domain